MKKIIIAAFDDEPSALKALDALSELNDNGSITVFATVVFARDASGAVSIRRPPDGGPMGAIVGMVSGALVGLLAGPMGAFAGASLGGLVATIRDLRKAGMDVDFVDEVAQHLAPGKTAVLTEVLEEVTAPLDERMKALGGTVVRRFRSALVEEVLAHEVEDERIEIIELQTELAEADEQLSEEVKRELAEARRKLEKTAAAIESRLASTQEEIDARIRYLQAQAEGASDRKKMHIQRRIEELQNDFDARTAKLKKAGALIAEAMS